MNPTVLLAVTAALFFAPASFVLSGSMIDAQGRLGAAPPPASAEMALWGVGIVGLLLPLTFSRLLRSSRRGVGLILALVSSISASVFGLTLSLSTGELLPVWILSALSMIAVLGWGWVFRESFRSKKDFAAVRGYTVILIVLGIVNLLFASMRIVLWDRIIDTAVETVTSGYMVFLESVIAITALATAFLRRGASRYARSSTQVLSWSLLVIPLLGTVTSLYWIFAVRKRELTPLQRLQNECQD